MLPLLLLGVVVIGVIAITTKRPPLTGPEAVDVATAFARANIVDQFTAFLEVARVVHREPHWLVEINFLFQEVPTTGAITFFVNEVTGNVDLQLPGTIASMAV